MDIGVDDVEVLKGESLTLHGDQSLHVSHIRHLVKSVDVGDLPDPGVVHVWSNE